MKNLKRVNKKSAACTCYYNRSCSFPQKSIFRKFIKKYQNIRRRRFFIKTTCNTSRCFLHNHQFYKNSGKEITALPPQALFVKNEGVEEIKYGA